MAVAPRMERISLSRAPEDLTHLPNLIEIQTRSYTDFLQWEVPPHERQGKGLQAVFNEYFPIESPNGLIKLEYVSYNLIPPRYTIEECQNLGLTYSGTLKALLRLTLYEESLKEERVEKQVLEQEVFIAEVPLMTPTGTFIINGAERVIVSQLHKSPGVSFERKQHPGGKYLLSSRIIPYRGAWIEFEYDTNDVLWVTVDRRIRMLATTLLKALGYVDSEEILKMFYRVDRVQIKRTKAFIYQKQKIKRGEKEIEKEVESKIEVRDLVGYWLANDIIDPETGEVIADASSQITTAVLNSLLRSPIREFYVLNRQDVLSDISIAQTLNMDQAQTQEDALREIYLRMRPGDPANDAQCRKHFESLFFDPARYDFASVGRYKINRKLGLQISQRQRTLTKEDIVETLKYLVRLHRGEGVLDDIDHLGNRRVRTVGEQLMNQFRIGLSRMEKTIRERMNYRSEEQELTPQVLVNPKPVGMVLKDFFGRSQLSHFMDQINPLSELTHKRRLSALGPGGLNRDRAGFEVRDVHPTHYGRICPIETPEGPNIGLMASMATYARVNDYGFIETPYYKVENGKVTNEIVYLTAYDEDNYKIAQASEPLDNKKKFKNHLVLCRHKGDFPLVSPEEVDFMDVSPKQIVSAAAALVPFLEHDDANRALMGSNMQRQAIPLLKSEQPLVGTGLEKICARYSGTAVRAERSGIVEYADSEQIRIRVDSSKTDNPFRLEEDVYNLKKFARSNQSTCINQKPIVSAGDKVNAEDIIADGPGMSDGEMALGRNVLVAFLPWEGYNFEDAIILSEELIKDDVFTSIQVEVFDIEARDTKLGPEEITPDIPNEGEESLKNLDENGIIHIGSKVKPGDILVGKVTPKGEQELAPEEKLLIAIFGEKAEDVRNASLYAPPGTEGVVVDVKVSSRRDKAMDKQTKSRITREAEKIKQAYATRIEKIRETFVNLVRDEIFGKRILESIFDYTKNDIVLEKGKAIKPSHLKELDYSILARLKIEDKKIQTKFTRLVNQAALEEAKLYAFREKELERLREGDELPPGVNKIVKVYIATKRKMSVGDKMAGRHGNKGVVARIVPIEDMPFLPDGTPIQIILNPLGVPSRMNVGQILETHLSWALQVLGMKVSSPVFNGPREETIVEYLKKAGLPTNGKIKLRDGKTGDDFHHETCVGYIYMMKLNHMVDDKIHARAIGPYSLVTQQPLGGKANSGGQRFGEMEVWALEAYGSAYTLQEMLTIKSDDIQGRTKIYDAIVKGDYDVEPSVPESFNVIIREMQSLCLDIIKLAKVETAIDIEEKEEEEDLYLG